MAFALASLVRMSAGTSRGRLVTSGFELNCALLERICGLLVHETGRFLGAIFALRGGTGRVFRPVGLTPEDPLPRRFRSLERCCGSVTGTRRRLARTLRSRGRISHDSVRSHPRPTSTRPNPGRPRCRSALRRVPCRRAGPSDRGLSRAET